MKLRFSLSKLRELFGNNPKFHTKKTNFSPITHQKIPCPQILWRNLSRIATKPWNYAKVFSFESFPVHGTDRPVSPVWGSFRLTPTSLCLWDATRLGLPDLVPMVSAFPCRSSRLCTAVSRQLSFSTACAQPRNYHFEQPIRKSSLTCSVFSRGIRLCWLMNQNCQSLNITILLVLLS